MVWKLLLIACISVATVSAGILFADNKTMCPWTNPYAAFQEYGYRDDDIPRDLNEYRPGLMHERSVLHFVDHLKQFRKVGEGACAVVYEGRLKTTGQAVIVKRLKDDDFEDLLEEAKLMAYLQGSRYIPRLFGLIPAGAEAGAISMVTEYIENSTQLEDLIEGERLSECAWISILQQTAEALREFHRKYVLFNDLHGSNVIVSWRGSHPRVHIIDFGSATFRTGRSHTGTHISTEYDFLSPETFYSLSTPASDVFSLGKGFEEIVKYINSSELAYLLKKCVSEDPRERPLLQNIIDFLNSLCMTKCSSCFHNETETEAETETELISGNPADNYTETVSIPLLSWDCVETIEEGDTDLKETFHTHIYLAKYKSTSKRVVVKAMRNITFEKIRHEAAVNHVMSDSGYVPALFGIASTGFSLQDIGLVQEYFADGRTLYDVLHIIQTLKFSIRIVLALELAEALTHFHKKGLIINNFKIDNVLIELVDSYPVIKIIDLSMSSFRPGHIDDFDDESIQYSDYLAPEIKENMMTSHASDVYSLGVILRDIFGANPDFRMSEIISLCLEEDPIKRPSILDVRMLTVKVAIIWAKV